MYETPSSPLSPSPQRHKLPAQSNSQPPHFLDNFYAQNYAQNHQQQRQRREQMMFPQELGLISQLVGQQRQRELLGDKSTKQEQMAALQNGTSIGHHPHQQQQRPNNNSAADLGESSSGDEANGSPSQSPAALISNLLVRGGPGSALRGNGPMAAVANVAAHQVNGGPQLDFATTVQSQLANYAGHFPEDMSNLFGSASSQIPAPFGVYAQNQQQPSTRSGASISGQQQPGPISIPVASGGRRHRSSEMIKCHFCPKRLPQATLQAHLEDCRQIRVHECSQCGKRFKARGGLQQHNRIHVNDRPYHCHYCPKTFTQKSHVDQHERIHTGAKPFACQYCGRQFRQRSQQMGHEATHVNRDRLTALANGAGVEISGTSGGMGAGIGVLNARTLGNGGGGSGTSDARNSSEQSSPVSEMAVGGPINLGHPHQQQRQQMLGTHQSHQQSYSTVATTCGGATSSLAIAAAAAQQQMAFNGLLRAVGSSGGGAGGFQSDSMAVDTLLAMSSMKRQTTMGGGGQDLDEQLRLMGR